MKLNRYVFIRVSLILLVFSSCKSTEKNSANNAVQTLAQKTLGNRSGTIVVMKAESNEIIALATNQNPETLYSAGSLSYLPIVKFLLEEKSFSLDSKTECNGATEINGKKISCSAVAGHGNISLKDAFAKTCDVFFAENIHNLDSDSLLKTASQFNFEISDKSWLLCPYNKAKANPLQMAQMMGSICKDDSNSGKTLKDLLRYRVTNGNPQFPLKNDSVQIAGTVATAEVPEIKMSGRWNSWCVVYAPYNASVKEQIVVSVLIDANNDWEWYAPYAANIVMQGYFNNQSYEEAIVELGFSEIAELKDH
jgi:penicillin-binding protein 2